MKSRLVMDPNSWMSKPDGGSAPRSLSRSQRNSTTDIQL